jgi:hypothetical protein
MYTTVKDYSMKDSHNYIMTRLRLQLVDDWCYNYMMARATTT